MSPGEVEGYVNGTSLYIHIPPEPTEGSESGCRHQRPRGQCRDWKCQGLPAKAGGP